MKGKRHFVCASRRFNAAPQNVICKQKLKYLRHQTQLTAIKKPRFQAPKRLQSGAVCSIIISISTANGKKERKKERTKERKKDGKTGLCTDSQRRCSSEAVFLPSHPRAETQLLQSAPGSARRASPSASVDALSFTEWGKIYTKPLLSEKFNLDTRRLRFDLLHSLCTTHTGHKYLLLENVFVS